MKILIIGAGIGGLSLAAFLKDSGIEYEIIERAPNWDHQGYSISLWNNGRNMLKKLGLDGFFDAECVPVHRYLVCGSDKRILRDYDLRDFYTKYGMALSLVSRTRLHELLIDLAGRQNIRMNTRIANIESDSNEAKVTFEDGSACSYDLVVGADGIHSQVRNLLFKNDFRLICGWNIWYMWIDKKFGKEHTILEYIAPDEFVSLFDSGDKMLAIIAAYGKSDKKGPEAIKGSFVKFKDIVAEMIEGVSDSEIVGGHLEHVQMDNWAKNRVVLVGDAAHGFEPHGGLGGSMAMEDGYVLAGELMTAAADTREGEISSESFQGKVSSSALCNALHAYESKRRRRIAQARMMTARMRGWALIRSKAIRFIVDRFIPYLPKRLFVRGYQAMLDEEI